MGAEGINKSNAIAALVTITLALVVFGAQFIDDTQAEFDLGTYNNTVYNGSAIILSGANVSGTYTGRVFDAGGNAVWNNLTWQGSTATISDSFLTAAMHLGTNRSEVFDLDGSYYLADMKDSGKNFYLNFSSNLVNNSIIKIHARKDNGVTIGIYAQSDVSGSNPLATFTVNSAAGEWHNISLNIQSSTNAVWLGEGTGSGTDPKDEFDYIYAEVPGANLTFQVRNCSFGNCSDGEFIEADLDNIDLAGRYFQYKVYFSTHDPGITPELYNVTIDYTLLNQPPIVSSLSLTPSSPKTTNALTCSFIITDADQGDSLTADVTWYKDNIVYDSDVQSVTNGTLESSIIGPSNTAKNEEWNCTVIPYDGKDYGSEDSKKVTILNSPPTAPDISLTPGSPYTNDDLVVDPDSQDDDGDSVAYIYRWYRDGEYKAGQITNTVSSTATSKHEVWLVNVTPNDGNEDGPSVQKNVTILNSLPSITSASITPATAYKTTTLTASAQGWVDADGESGAYTYQWFNQNGAITGATSPALTGTYFNKSDQIYCNVTPYDSDDYGTPRSSSTVTIQNSLPVLTVSLATDLGFNGIDEDLIGSFAYSDADSDTMTNNQTKWFKNNIEQTNLADLTALSYTNTSADDIWIFSAMAYDGQNWGNWFNSSPLTILDVSQTYPTLISPPNGTYFNISSVILKYRTPNYANMTCTIFADTNINPVSIITATNFTGKGNFIYNWKNLADNTYYWKVGCTNDSILYNSTIKTFTIDTTFPVTSPNLIQADDPDKDGNIELSWTDDPDAYLYNIYRSSSEILDAANLEKIAATSSLFWEDNTTLHNENYWYALTTVDGAGNENKSVVSNSLNGTANDTIKPKLPLNLTATSFQGITTLIWNKATEDIQGNHDELDLKYKIWYSSASIINLSKSLVSETADYTKIVGQETCSASLCTTYHSLSGSTEYYYFITTIDDADNENLTLGRNFASLNVTASPPTPPSPGGESRGSGGGGGSGGIFYKRDCSEQWSCSKWYSCINGTQARTCVDTNNCRTNKNKPSETRVCGSCVEDWQCGDWTPCVNNRQTKVCFDKNECETENNRPEQERDCMLDTCSDRIKNYGEVGIDCGGPCRACRVRDFLTGGAIALKSSTKPNPFLLIPTMFLLTAFIVIRSIRKSHLKIKKIVETLHLPIIIVILVLLFLSFFGAGIIGLFKAGETPSDYEMVEDRITGLSTNVQYDEGKAKITSTIFLVLASAVLIAVILKKRYPDKFRLKKAAKSHGSWLIEGKKHDIMIEAALEEIEGAHLAEEEANIKAEPAPESLEKNKLQEVRKNVSQIEQVQKEIKTLPSAQNKDEIKEPKTRQEILGQIKKII